MADNEIKIDTGKRTKGEFAIAYQQAGRGGMIPVINGTPAPELMFGYVSESDKNACMNLIEEALRATNCNTYEAMRYIQNAVSVAAHDVHPDEAVDVEGTEILINYELKKAYRGHEEIANLDDVECELPKEAVKVMLVDRVKHVLAEENRNYYDDEDDEDDEDEHDEIYDDYSDYEEELDNAAADGYAEGYSEGYQDGVDNATIYII